MRNFYPLLLSGLLLCLTAGLNGQILGVGLTDGDGEVGETVCINIVGENFVGISGMQFSITFDPLVLELASSMGSINGNNVSLINNQNQPGIIRVLYAPFSTTGYTDPGPFVIGQLCFLILQEVETEVVIGSSPTPLEFADDMGNIFEDEGEVNITSNGLINGGVVGTATCTDGIQNGQETGVDCGGPDCPTCPTCTDGIRNGNETGVDCGGPDCPACPATCTDGIRNGSETGVDCGGPDCPACPPSCTDGIRNGSETGVDCGGPDCPTCPPTCTDGIQNGSETGVDCGGPDCPACPTCTDGIRNGGETGIDCGGPNCSACISCNDGIQNGNETGIDCGGPDCQPCSMNEVCGAGSNFFNLCVADACDIPVNGNFCVDLTVSMFTNITGLQFILSYPAASLDFVSFTSPALGPSLQLNEFSDGNLRALYVDNDQSGETLEDGTVVTTICFTNEIAGPTNIEVASVQVGDTDGMVPGAVGNDGSVNGSGCNGGVATCTDGIQNGNETGVDCGGPDCAACMTMPTCTDGIQNGNETGVDCGGPDCQPCVAEECGAGSSAFNLCVEDACNVAVNGNVCLDVTVSNFTNITGLQFRLAYPAANLEFTSVTSPSALGPALQVNENADGDIRAIYIDSDQSGESLDDGTVIATICFTNETAGATVIDVASLQVGNTNGMVVGPIGNDGSVNGSGCNGGVATCTDGIQNGNETGVDCGGPDCQPCVAEECGAGSSAFNLCVEDACNIAVNGNVCLDVTVSNFTNITGLQFRLAYPAANLEFTSVTSPSALGPALQVNENADGDIRAIYIDSDQSGESLDDGTVIATICFTNETAGATVIDVASLQVGNTNGMVVGPIGNDGLVNAAGCGGNTATCSDGIQNNGETDVDCGGPNCAACPATDCGEGTTDVEVCIGSVCGDAGAIVCVPVMVGNFDNLGGLQFSLDFAAGNLNYTSFTAHPSLQNGTTVASSADGVVNLVWNDPNLAGISLDPTDLAFEICFVVENTMATPLTFRDPEVNLRVFNTIGGRLPASGSPGAVNQNCGDTSTCTDGIMNGKETGVDCGGPDCSPCGGVTGTDCGMDSDVFSICVGDACDVAQNGQACVDLFAGNFTDIVGFQMDIFYPGANLEFQSFTSSVLGSELQGNDLSDGNVRLVFFDSDLSGVTVADGTSIGTICFTNEIAGTTILDADNLRGSNTSGMFTVPEPMANDGMVNGCMVGSSCTNGIQDGNEEGIDCGGDCPNACVTCDDGIMNGDETGIDCGGSCPNTCPTGLQPRFSVGSGMAAAGEEVCINVSVRDFTNLASVMMTLNYDATALQFVSVTGNSALPEFGPANFNTNTSGQVIINYTPPSPQTLTNGQPFFTVCFTLLGGPPTNVTLTNISVTDGGGNSLIATTSRGTISETVTYDNFTLVAGSTSGTQGTEVCLDITVFNLVDLAGLQFAVSYDDERLSFNSGTGTGALAGLQVVNPRSGILRVIWFDPNVEANSVADGISIVQLCFDVLQECETAIEITDDLPMFSIRAASPSGQAISPVDRVAGAVNGGDTDCGGDGPPPNLVLQLGSGTGLPGTEVCIDLPATNFINLTDLSFSLSYDPAKVTFQRATNFGLPSITAANVNTASVASPSPNRVVFNWTSPFGPGESIPNGNSVVSFCFTVEQLSSAPVNFGNNPTAILARNGNDQAVGVIPTGGVINSDMLVITNSVLTNPVCAGASDGSISLTVSGGTSLSYQWSPSVSSSETAVGLAAGTYSVTISNGNASTEETFTLTDPGPFAIEVASVGGVSCSGEEDGQITIAPVGNNGPFTYNWSGSLQDGVGVNQQTNLAGDSYSVTVTDRFGCPRILNNIMVGEPLPLNIVGSEFKITRDTPGGVTIEVTGGRTPFTYSWTGPNGYTSSVEDIADATEPGTYCLTVTDNNACTDTQCFGIIRDIDITSTVIDQGCRGEDNASIDITVIGGNGAYNYVWSSEGTTISSDQDLDGIAPGDYQVMITSGECQITQTITVEAPEPILLPGTVTPATSGDNGAITLTPSGGNPPFTFTWGDGPTTQNRSGLSSGQYCVTATAEGGCTASMCYTVATEQASILSVSTSTTSCSDTEDGTVTILVSNGTAPFNVRVAPLGTTENFAENITLELGAGTYTIFITDAQGAMLDTVVTVSTPDAITATTTVSSDTEAAGCSGMINLNIEGGTGPYTVAWNDGMAGATRSLLCAGDYTPTITDANGCTFEPGTATVSRIDEELVAVTDVACADGTEGGIDVSITGGVLPYTFAWTRASAPDVLSTSEDLVASEVTGGVAAGDYTLTVTDATGAMLVMNYTVGISAGFSATVAVVSDYNGFGTSCVGSADGRIEIVISGQGDFMYEYLLDGAMVGVDSILPNAVAGTYTVTVIDAGGCEITRMVEVTAPPALVLNEDIDNISCGNENDGSIAVETTGGIMPYVYSWSTGAMTSRISGLGAGTYAVTVTDGNNCTSTESYSLTAPEDLAITFEAIDATDGCNGSVRIIPLGGSGNYRFTFPQLPNQGNDPFAEGLCPGVYTIQVTDDNECQTVTMMAEVLDRRFPCLSARDVITPNGDGLNEAFVISCSDGVDAINNSLQVFNRWGQLVYRAMDYDCSDNNGGINCFEGRTNDGTILPEGPYYYIFEFTNPLGEEMQQRGSLTILRD